MDKLVSIIIPTYNGARFISKSIESVLSQSYSNWELFIIDDGSTDNTAEVVSSFISNDKRIMYLKNENNLGIQKTLNRGLHESKGEYIARIDDDDIWNDKDKIKKQVEFLNNNMDHGLVGTGAIIIDEKGYQISKYLLPSEDSEIRKQILSKNCFVHSSVMYKKNTALNIGGYSELVEMKHIEDYELWLRLGTSGKFANIPSYSVTLLVQPSSLTARHRILQAKRMLNIILKYKDKYPRFIIGYCTSFARLIFFSIQKIIPLPPQILYKLQAWQRGG